MLGSYRTVNKGLAALIVGKALPRIMNIVCLLFMGS